MPTIKDVAKHAGVSRSTVSRVLNNHPYVDEEKRRSVKNSMKELGYLPNSSAQRLRGTQTRTIAVLVARIMNPFFSAIVDAMDEVANAHSYRLILCNTRNSKKQELHYLQLLRTKQVDGVVLASLENDWSVIEPYVAYGPIVVCNEYPPENKSVTVVTINQTKAMYAATTHLIEKGHTAISYCNVIGHSASALSEDRRKGFVQAMNEHRLPMKKTWNFKGHSIESGRKIVSEMLALAEKPTAILTGSDEVAAGVIAQSKMEGLSVPGDLAVVGFDDQAVASLLEPQITTIRQPTEELGRKTMELILSIVTTGEMEVGTYYFSAPLIQRQST
ncbi:LacI family DNA-binding transcriptional regulator [Shouchella shacheensis]|uniref:LacI family DNA-binding transcriptional regulator n=1 Tax=Shouchella shacheensis TaxID=1649580 RepID=UPI00073FB6F2|nr:LacI family DNA-binding transcriptional regulator [Shouchella shacheensis]